MHYRAYPSPASVYLNFRHTQTLIKTLRRTQQISTSNRTQQISTNKTEISARENTWYIVGHGRRDDKIAKMAPKKRAEKVFRSFLLWNASTIQAQKHRLASMGGKLPIHWISHNNFLQKLIKWSSTRSAESVAN